MEASAEIIPSACRTGHTAWKLVRDLVILQASLMSGWRAISGLVSEETLQGVGRPNLFPRSWKSGPEIVLRPVIVAVMCRYAALDTHVGPLTTPNSASSSAKRTKVSEI